MRLTLPIMSMVITLNPLLKFSAGQWNTLVNIGLALCGLAGQDCIGTNSTFGFAMVACTGALRPQLDRTALPEQRGDLAAIDPHDSPR
jgi:hypothetical protein